MVSVNPNYKQKGKPNPYYVMSPPVVRLTIAALKKEGIDASATDLYFKSLGIDGTGEGKLIYKNTGKHLFQLALEKGQEIQYYIKVSSGPSDVTGHLGMATRKDSTASSNVNEFLTVYYLLHKCETTDKLHELSCTKGNQSTGVLTGEGNAVTYEDLCMLLDKDQSANRDIEIGMKNANAVSKDINGEKIAKVYWVPRGKPAGISPKTPSDVIIEFKDGTFQGYSNKVTTTGQDDTPKFNTNIYAFYGKLEDSKQKGAIAKIIDQAWNDAAADVKKPTAKAALASLDISEEAFSETKSSAAFAKLADNFALDGLDFYTNGFYWPFRNNLIKSFSKYLETPVNMVYFLNTIYFYTYDDPRTTFKPCPYKLLVGSASGPSRISDVSENEELKEMLANTDPKKITSISTQYDGNSQSFTLKFKFGLGTPKQNVSIKITCRTRAAGGWQGKSLYINTPGVKFV